ncbi:hypothetical protein N7532_008233 [Penicillium argentinense]|uniref:N-acetyltransferase domain-containing protein n=1 Tax=Penicillium argentinense TaxID=1131581 RepID=A0A9W9K1E7_9EURO|nr:uncharacterized protein N7532_008233 [Penicillium argentinense]KAJ5089549.1 hypothetical protein N7532_008233 [Penicillium argentinense]
MKAEPPVVTKGTLYPEQPVRVIIPADVNVIHTKNLRLRPLMLSDAADLFEFRSRQDVADWLWPRDPHKNIQETEANIATKTFQTPDASGAIGRRFYFGIISASDPKQKVVGAVGINSLLPAPSIGYGLHPDIWGKGYASEAVAGVIGAWWNLERIDPVNAEAVPKAERLFAGCNNTNIGSVKVLQKNGFRNFGVVRVEDDTVARFELERPN